MMKYDFFVKTRGVDWDYCWKSLPSYVSSEIKTKCERILSSFREVADEYGKTNCFYLKDNTCAVLFRIVSSKEIDIQGRKIVSLEGFSADRFEMEGFWKDIPQLIGFLLGFSYSLRDNKKKLKLEYNEKCEIDRLMEKYQKDKIREKNAFHYLESFVQSKSYQETDILFYGNYPKAEELLETRNSEYIINSEKTDYEIVESKIDDPVDKRNSFISTLGLWGKNRERKQENEEFSIEEIKKEESPEINSENLLIKDLDTNDLKPVLELKLEDKIDISFLDKFYQNDLQKYRLEISQDKNGEIFYQWKKADNQEGYKDGEIKKIEDEF